MKRAKILMIAGAVSLSVFLAVPPSLAETSTIAAGAASSEITGTVVVVNTKKRLMTIQLPNGDFQVINVPEEVKRLDEIKINDKLTITYTAAVAVDLQKGPDADAPGAAVVREVDRKAGRLPAGTITDTAVLSGLITAVNPSNSTITVKGAKETETLAVDNPELLAQFSVGDTVTATFIRAVAAKVEGFRPGKDASGRPGT